jgi:hypothetical protein
MPMRKIISILIAAFIFVLSLLLMFSHIGEKYYYIICLTVIFLDVVNIFIMKQA